MNLVGMHHLGPKRARPGRRGTSLVVTAVLVSSLAAVALSLASMSRSSSNENRAVRDETNAYYVAQAGLAEAVQDLRLGGTGAVGSIDVQQDFGGARFWVDSTDLGNGLRSLVSTGLDDRAGARIELVVQQLNLPLFRFGAFGDQELTMDSNARIDSYDSSVASYVELLANQNGNAGSNGPISLRQNSHIRGSAISGPGETVTILGNATVSGATTPAPTVLELPAIDFPVVPSQGDYTLGGLLGLDTFLPGTYSFDDFKLNSNTTLTINGPATVICDSLELRSNSTILVNSAGGPVDFYVQGDFILRSNAQVHSLTETPSDVKFWLNGDNILDPDVDVDFPDDSLLLNQNSKIHGVLYAPNAFVEITSNFELFGSIMARRLHLGSNARIHFDEALMTETDDDFEVVLETIAWRRRPFSMNEPGL